MNAIGNDTLPTHAEIDRLICLSLGSNIQPEKHLAKAIQALEEFLTITAASQAWRSPSIGSPGPDFINLTVLVRTHLAPETLKTEIVSRIVTSLGRQWTSDKNAPRTIDIDILLVGDKVWDEQLWNYAHLAIPTAELYPELTNPHSGETLAQVAERLRRAVNISPCLEFPRPGCFDQPTSSQK